MRDTQRNLGSDPAWIGYGRAAATTLRLPQTLAICSAVLSLATLDYWSLPIAYWVDGYIYKIVLLATAMLLTILSFKCVRSGTSARLFAYLSILCLLYGTAVVTRQIQAQVEKREFQFRRIKDDCAIDMEGVGKGVELYAQEHHKFARNLNDLWFPPGVAVCPAVRGTARARPYQYWAADLTYPCNSAAILISEPLENHEGNGINVYSGDGKVRFLKGEIARAVLADLKAGYNPPRAQYQK